MTAAKTPQQRGRANQAKGKTAERDLCKWLRSNGFPGAERAVRTGFRTVDRTSDDPGDITGTPGIIWSVKDCAVERIDQWFDELDAMDAEPHNLRLLINKRRGHADPARWWCWQWETQRLDLYRTWLEQFDFVRQVPPMPAWTAIGTCYPIRMELGHALVSIRDAGYGTPMQAEAS